MGRTTKYQLPYPALTDQANVPEDMQELAEKAEEVLASIDGRTLKFELIETFDFEEG